MELFGLFAWGRKSVNLKERLKWGIMKIVDYLIIVSSWVLSSYTFSSSDVEFKKLKQENGVYEIQFGIVGEKQTKSLEVESILASLPYHQTKEVVKVGQDFFITLRTTEEPDFRFYRTAFKSKGYEMDERFFVFHNEELKSAVESGIIKLKSAR